MKIEFKHCVELERTGLVTAIYTKGAHAWVCRIEGEEEDAESLANYASIAYSLEIPMTQIVRGCQQHTNTVQVACAQDGGEGVLRASRFSANDGFITNESELLIATGEADCLPIYLLDPLNKAIGMVHSGWRGTAQLIGVRAVELMGETYGTNAEDLLVYFGPHICGKCYEVGAELMKDFSAAFSQEEIEQFFIPADKATAPDSLTVRDEATTSEGLGKYYLDNALAVRISLIRAGIVPEHLFDCGICSYENDDYTSYRQTGAKRPRMLTAIMLNK